MPAATPPSTSAPSSPTSRARGAYSAKPDAPSTFIISDYGRGKVCIELEPGHDGTPINEERLIRQFRQNIDAFCAERAMDDMADVGVTLESLSLDDLPKAAITDMGAGTKASPMIVKGQQALSELKSGREAKQQDKESRKQAVINNPMLNPDGTKMSLLDRLRLKQLAKANEPLAPAGPELQRRAALNRVVDVAATISMLSLSNPLSLPRQAFTMMAISEKLRDSLRMPLSKEEGMACVRLIATEVAPEWLRVVTIGGRENVVVQRNGQPVDRVIQERVQKLLA
ncbi:DNA mismatch repair protein [Hirsutella rhossiliensis]|uniref:DNA mismatch repair protein Msh2 n=1 Tax=Hirsutella rhossiliensis TaxID=111463 RepID=A0A9P8NAJ1_9HYPO|nr:DNA mismatch repair protein Msh2 [Hirsutella rhossiliensis]KAH0967602.1 DNA mismatch repair protein Msh2 [Hirsutella rhossiliensis]